jgi:hypothetical protein
MFFTDKADSQSSACNSTTGCFSRIVFEIVCFFAGTLALNAAWVFEKVQHGFNGADDSISLRVPQLHGHLKKFAPHF